MGFTDFMVAASFFRALWCQAQPLFLGVLPMSPLHVSVSSLLACFITLLLFNLSLLGSHKKLPAFLQEPSFVRL